MAYETFYEGGDNFLMPPKYMQKLYGEIGEVSFGELGTAVDPRTANQLGEINLKINPGVKHVELQGTSAQVWESVPEQHLDEIRRLSKLTGTTTSLHGPIVEASGVGEKGWEEINRLGAEKQIESAVLRAHKLNPDGNISVTLHSTTSLPEMEPKIKTKEGKEYIEKPIGAIWVVDYETGKFGQIPYDKRYFPEEGKLEYTEKGEIKAVEPNRDFILKKFNEDNWTQQLADINRMAAYGEERIDSIRKNNPKVFQEVIKGINPDDFKKEDETEKKILTTFQREINHGQIYLRDSYRNLKKLFDIAYPNAKGEDKEKLRKFAEEVRTKITPEIETSPQKLEILGQVVEDGLKTLSQIKNVEIYKPMNDFVVEKTAETFGNVATNAYKKFGEKAPVINIENPPAGGGLSTAEDLKKVVEKTREKFVGNLMKEGVSESEAKSAAEKLIGATWDVGHINMLRKKGYTGEDIVKQTKIIAPFVKHVHLSDNFGYEHTELPMGMGNVPMKEILAKLGEEGFEGKKIVEAGNWWQFFSEKGGGNPLKPTIEAFNSPIYAMKAGPYWSQPTGFSPYYSGYGAVNPSIHHTTYGAGFTTLPASLGGEMPGTQSRFAGTPNQ